VRVDQIDETVGPRPAARLVENVRRNGVVVPVILAERVDDDGELHLVIVDGNRRIAAAREAGIAEVPARIVQDASEPEIANLTLVTNTFRSSNYVTEFWAMNELQRAGVDRKRLAEVTGMSASTLATREHLANLDRTLFLGLTDGRIPPTVALAAARLDREAQDRLAAVFQRTGRLAKSDVDALKPADPPADLPDIDTSGRVLPGDLQQALIAIARQAIARGIDAITFVEAAGRAHREVGGAVPDEDDDA
jgi:ParB-like chromosome segregation protein Spo0J